MEERRDSGDFQKFGNINDMELGNQNPQVNQVVLPMTNNSQDNRGYVPWDFNNPKTIWQFDPQEPTYEGERDQSGLPHHKGKMTFVDGSTYQGDFVHGQQEGQGHFTAKEGFSYKGLWRGGCKHGRGLMTLKTGEEFDATWDTGVLDGEGSYKDEKGNSQTVMWYKGIMVPLGSQGRTCYDKSFLNIFFVIGMIVFIVLGIILNPLYFIGVGICWLVQFIESLCSHSNKYFGNIEPLTHTGTMINTLKMTRPHIVFKIQNWHMEQRTRQVSYQDGEGHTKHRTEHYEVRVNTWYNQEDFGFNQWTDYSADPMSIGFIGSFHLTRLKFYKIFNYTTYASHNYYCQKDAFIHHNIKDVHHDFWVVEEVPGYRENVLIFNDQKGDRPWFTKRCNFILLALFGMSWIQRIKFVNASTKVRFTISKMILN